MKTDNRNYIVNRDDVYVGNVCDIDPEKIEGYYVQNIQEYLEYLNSSEREKDKLRIPIVKKYIK